MAELPWTVKHGSRNVCDVEIPVVGGASKFEQWFLLRSDVHHDNPKSDRELEKRHLDEALARNAGIIDAGDLFCVMQGKYDKRSSKAALRPEHQVDHYFDAVVSTAADFYTPYAKNIIVIGRGNHEQAVKKRHEIDLTERIVSILNDRTGSNIQCGGYTGWVRFQLRMSTQVATRVLWYTHGAGGGGPVTKGTIKTNRRQVMIENADVILSGHIHEAWHLETQRLKLNRSLNVESRTTHHVQSATYKDDYGDGYEGWHVEREMPPKPLGAWWMRFWWDVRARTPRIEFTRAS